MATISSLLADHVSLQVRSLDRLFLQGYVPRLMTEGQVIRFLLDRGFPIPSPAALGKIGQAYVRAIERFAARNRIPLVHFKKGESKELVARRYMRKAERDGRFGVVMVGIAQEKTSAWRGFVGRRVGVASALLLPPDVDLPQLLLHLYPRPRVRSRVYQDVRVRAVGRVDLPQRARVGQAPGREARARVPSA